MGSDSESDYAPCRRDSPQNHAAPYQLSDRRRSVEQSVAISSAAPPAVIWKIWASQEQVKVPPEKLTHIRKLPLPFTIDGRIMGQNYWQLQYAGHGQSKTVYRLTDKLVLKMCLTLDQEPELFKALEATGIYPVVHDSCQCQVFGSAGLPVQTWHAWVMDYAKPLDQILQEHPATSYFCILGAVHAMVKAHSMKHLVSDNALFNFGMVQNNVVIIDAGSRLETPTTTKGTFNRNVLKRFWSKAQTLVQPEDLKVHKDEWYVAPSDMQEVLLTYQERRQKLRNDQQLVPVLNSLEVPISNFSACPHVASVLDFLDDETLDWLTQKYLWDKLSQYGPSVDGYMRLHLDSHWTAAQKLERLISETTAQRADHCDHSADDILNEYKLKQILNGWKNDYKRWMRPETLEQTWNMSPQNWHQTLRKAFRSHLFQFVGSFEMVVFFIVVRFNNDHLLVFRHHTEQVAMEGVPDKERNARILEQSKDFVRATNNNCERCGVRFSARCCWGPYGHFLCDVCFSESI